MSVHISDQIIKKEWIDYNNHMNMAYYVLVFDDVWEIILKKFQMGENSAKSTNMSTMVVETHTTYNSEVKLGDEVEINLTFFDHDKKRLHFKMEMIEKSSRKLSATLEMLSLYIDLKKRKVAEFEQEKIDIMDKFIATNKDQFESNNLEDSASVFTKVQKQYPNNSVSAYYLGLIALQKDNTSEVLKQWRKYIQLDPIGAEKNQVQSQLTIIENEALDSEVANLLQSELSRSGEKPEPNSIAVFNFSNRGDAKYNVLAKGLTALVITDLSKVPGIKVLEREKIQKLVSEMKLSKSGLVKQESKVRAGKLMKAEKLMFGEFKVE